MNNTVYIYRLICPLINKTRYIGKTTNLDRRLKQHMKTKSNSNCGKWIKKLAGLGLTPLIKVIEITNLTDWPLREVHHIAQYRKRGVKLLNSTKGGHDMPIIPAYVKRGKTKGKPMSEETRQKLSLAKKGKTPNWSAEEIVRRKEMFKALHSKRTPEQIKAHMEKMRIAHQKACLERRADKQLSKEEIKENAWIVTVLKEADRL